MKECHGEWVAWNLCQVFPWALRLPEPRRRSSAMTSPGSRWTGINWVPETLNARQIYEDLAYHLSPPLTPHSMTPPLLSASLFLDPGQAPELSKVWFLDHWPLPHWKMEGRCLLSYVQSPTESRRIWELRFDESASGHTGLIKPRRASCPR